MKTLGLVYGIIKNTKFKREFLKIGVLWNRLDELEPLCGSSHLSHKQGQMGTEVRNRDISLGFVAFDGEAWG